MVSAAWRFKLALRMEAKRLKPQLETDNEQDSAEVTTETPCWYTSGRQGLNIAAKGLRGLREEVRVSGAMHLENHKGWIVSTFGSDFYRSLAECGPTNKDAILMAEMLVQHAADFRQPLPESGVSVNIRPIDERARWDMMVKVVDLKMQEVSEFYRLLGQSVGESESPQTVALDVVNRYVTTTSRELEHAVDWYGQLLEKGL